MKIAFACSGKGGLEDQISDRFGRCSSFTIVEVEEGRIKSVNVIPNPGLQAGSGAGIKAIKTVVNSGAKVIVAGSLGPNAMAAAQELGIKHISVSGKKVKDALNEVIAMLK